MFVCGLALAVADTSYETKSDYKVESKPYAAVQYGQREYSRPAPAYNKEYKTEYKPAVVQYRPTYYERRPTVFYLLAF